jgi:hypothetical protein
VAHGTCVFKRGGRRGGKPEAGAKGGECQGHGLVRRRVAVDERSSDDALRALVSFGTLEELSRYRSAAHSVEAVLAGRRESDWTAEVVTSRSLHMNCMRRPMSIVRG